MLMGIFQNSIDGKNRVSIPAKCRTELGQRCVLTIGLDDCLMLYPMDTWLSETANYGKLPRSDEKARAFIRYVYGNAEEVEIDKQGRLLVPQRLKEFAHMEKELVTIGTVDRIEIWAKEVYEGNPNGGKVTAKDLAVIGEKYQV